MKKEPQQNIPILRSVKKQGAATNLYNILSHTLLIFLCISYSIEDETSQNDVQEKKGRPFQNHKYRYSNAMF
jgi:hypothetical protein